MKISPMDLKPGDYIPSLKGVVATAPDNISDLYGKVTESDPDLILVKVSGIDAEPISIGWMSDEEVEVIRTTSTGITREDVDLIMDPPEVGPRTVVMGDFVGWYRTCVSGPQALTVLGRRVYEAQNGPQGGSNKVDEDDDTLKF